jgi:hypothetical protein
MARVGRTVGLVLMRPDFSSDKAELGFIDSSSWKPSMALVQRNMLMH